MENLLIEKCEPAVLSPLTLAFMGDAVYDMLVRQMLVCRANRPAKKLHESAVKSVRASAQAQAYEKLLPVLSQEELAILKRGRNAHVNHIPKNANQKEYHYATAVEALFGYLYLTGSIDRVNELFEFIVKAEQENEG